MKIRDLFSSRPISLGLQGAAAVAAAAPPAASSAAPPMQVQATPDVLRRGEWRGRPVETRSIAPSATPSTIASSLREAEGGYPASFLQLLQEVTDRDYQTVACLGTRKRAVAQRAWKVTPAGEKATDRKIAAWVERVLGRIANFESALVDLLGAIESGYAGVEINWQVIDQAGKTEVLPVSLDYRPPWWLKPSPENPEEFYLLDRANLYDGVPLTPKRWIVHVARAKPGFPTQAALGRVLLWWWLLKHYASKDWATYSEMFGTPMRVAEAPPGADDDAMDDMGDALDALGAQSYAVIPPGWKISFPTAGSGKSGPDVYERLVNLADRAIAKLILGQTLTTEPGESGSYALGQVHNDVRFDLVKADAKQLASTITRQLLAPLIEFNFGAGVPVPLFEFLVEPAKDTQKEATAQQTRAGVFAAALKLPGVRLSRAQVYRELALEEPLDEADVLEGAPAPEPAADDTDDDTDTDTEDAEEGDEE